MRDKPSAKSQLVALKKSSSVPPSLIHQRLAPNPTLFLIFILMYICAVVPKIAIQMLMHSNALCSWWTVRYKKKKDGGYHLLCKDNVKDLWERLELYSMLLLLPASVTLNKKYRATRLHMLPPNSPRIISASQHSSTETSFTMQLKDKLEMGCSESDPCKEGGSTIM